MTEGAAAGGPPASGGKGKGKALKVGGTELGPFPPAVWIGIAGAGVAIGLIWRLKSKGGGGTSSKSSTEVGAPSYPGGYPLGAGGTGAGPGQLPDTDSGISSNSAWLSKSVERLIAEGQNPTLVHGALQKFLRGDPLTPQERAIVDMAVRYFGSPPEGAAAAVDAVLTATIGDVVKPPWTAPMMDPNPTPQPVTQPTPNPAPVDLRALSPQALIERADQLVRSGSGYESAVAEITRRVTVDRSMDVNSAYWRNGNDPNGDPRAIWYVAAPQILQWLHNQGARF